MRPRIGIPPSLEGAGGSPARRVHRLDAAYADAVAEAGGVPFYLPSSGPIEAQVAAIDGLLLPGGPDFVPPRPYPPGVRFAPAPPEQLDFDCALLDAARSAGLPALGVCYGMQLISLANGGVLHYHVPCDVPDALEHCAADPAARHPVELVPGTHLARLFGVRALSVNSRHHQAVSEPGPGLAIAARAGDGLIEAIEAEDRGVFLIGVQWHPEALEAAHRSILYAALVEAARRARSGRARRGIGTA